MNKAKNDNAKSFILAYLYSYAITFVLVLFDRLFIFIYQSIISKDLTYQSFEIFSLAEGSFSAAFFSPFFLLITAITMGQWIPKYLILVVLYAVVMFSIYKIQQYELC